MGHRIVYIEKCEYLRLYLDNLKVDFKNDELLFPISDIQVLVIDNYKSTMSIPLINKLTENNVCVVVCGIDHLPQSYLLPMNGHFAQSGNIMKQTSWSKEAKELLHQLIIKAKIQNQITVLKRNNKSQDVIQKLLQFKKEVDLGDSTNREGLAAKLYFREMFGNDFIRMEEDVVNAGLNYGYSIFRSLITSIVVAKGYLPNIGLFHRGKQNMFNLSDDIIEVFRPIVDHYVLNNMIDDILFKQEHKEALIELTAKKIDIDDRKQTVSNAIYVYIESIIKTIDSLNINDFIFPLPYLYDI